MTRSHILDIQTITEMRRKAAQIREARARRERERAEREHIRLAGEVTATETTLRSTSGTPPELPTETARLVWRSRLLSFGARLTQQCTEAAEARTQAETEHNIELAALRHASLRADAAGSRVRQWKSEEERRGNTRLDETMQELFSARHETRRQTTRGSRIP